MLQTLRSHDQYNTTVYGLDDRYRGIRGGRRVVFLNADDIAELGFADGDHVDLVGVWSDGERRAESFRIVAYDDAARDGGRVLPRDQCARAARLDRRGIQPARLEGGGGAAGTVARAGPGLTRRLGPAVLSPPGVSGGANSTRTVEILGDVAESVFDVPVDRDDRAGADRVVRHPRPAVSPSRAARGRSRRRRAGADDRCRPPGIWYTPIEKPGLRRISEYGPGLAGRTRGQLVSREGLESRHVSSSICA